MGGSAWSESAAEQSAGEIHSDINGGNVTAPLPLVAILLITFNYEGREITFFISDTARSSRGPMCCAPASLCAPSLCAPSLRPAGLRPAGLRPAALRPAALRRAALG